MINYLLFGAHLTTCIDLVLSFLYYEKGNLASILEIEENLNYYFNIFSDSPDNLRKDFGGAKPV